MVSYVTLPDEKINKENLIKNKDFMRHTRDFLLKRNNQAFDTNEETFNAFLDHMRKSEVGDVTPFGNWQYASDANPKERAEYGALQNVFDRYNGSEDFLSLETLDKITDYVIPALDPTESPSTIAGVFTGGSGKVAAMLASQGVKIGLKKFIGLALRDSLKTVAVEGSTGALVGATKGETRRLLGDTESNWKTGALKEGTIRGAGALVTGGALGFYAAKKGARLGESVLAKGQEAEKVLAAEAKKQTEQVLKSKKAKTQQDPHAYIKGETDAVTDTEVKFFADKLKSLDEDLVSAGIDIKKTLGADTLDEALVAGLSRETVQSVVAAGVEIGKLVGWKSTDSKERITERVARALSEGEVIDASGNKVEFSIDVLDGLAERFNLTREDLGSLWAAEISEAARTLRSARTIKDIGESPFTKVKEGVADLPINEASKMKRDEINTLIKFVNDRFGTPATAEMADKIFRVSEMGNTARKFFNTQIGGTLLGLNKLRLGLMTSKLTTTIRNAANVGLRLPMHMIEYVGTGGSIVDAARIPFDLLFDKTESEILATVFERANPKQFKQIFRDAMDIEASAGLGFVGGKLTSLGRKVNAHNTFVDNTVKKAVLLGEFRKIARSQGQDLFEDVIAKGQFKSFLNKNRKLVEESMSDTLSLVYQKGYKKGSIGGRFIELFSQSKFSLLTSIVIPFPRYLANQTEFIYKHTPVIAAIAPLTKKFVFQTGRKTYTKGKKAGQLTEEAKAFNRDFRKRMSEQVSGLGLMYTAMQFKIGQGPDMAWNEFKNKDGQVYDLTALLGPFAAMFFAVDLWYRFNEGNIKLPIVPNLAKNNDVKLSRPSSAKDVIRSGIQAFTGIQARTGTGLYFLDSLVDSVLTDKKSLVSTDEGVANPAFERILTKVAADWVNTFTIPVGMFTELQSTFDPEGRKIMDNDRIDLNQYFWNYALRSLPNTEALRNTGKFLMPEGSQVYGAYTNEKEFDSGFSDFIEGLRGKQVEQRFPIGKTRTRVTPFVRELTGVSPKYDFMGKPMIEREATRLGLSRNLLTPRDKIPEIERFKKEHMANEEFKILGLINSNRYQNNTVENQKIQLTIALKSAKKQANKRGMLGLSTELQQLKNKERFYALPEELRTSTLKELKRLGKDENDFISALSIAKQLQKAYDVYK